MCDMLCCVLWCPDHAQVTWLDQLYRSMAGDRLYHLEERDIESVTLVTLQAVIERTVNVTDLPLAVFTAPSVEVRGASTAFEPRIGCPRPKKRSIVE